MERIRELVISGDEISEINGIDHHIGSISEMNAKTGDLLSALNDLKNAGIRSIVNVDRNGCVIKLKSSDMLTLAMQREAAFESRGDSFHAKVAIGKTSVEGVLSQIDVFNIEREKNAFIFSAAGLKARDLYEFMESLGAVDIRDVEHYLYNGDFGRWLEGIDKKPLAKSFSLIAKKGAMGDDLRLRLVEATKNYVKDSVKKEVKAKIKKELKEKLVSAMEEIGSQ